jgi:hypothetical protein
VEAIKTVPYVPLSHPFVERLIGTIRRECLDRTLFWTAADLELKLLEFQRYFNGHRTHAGLGGLTPEPRTEEDRARATRAPCPGLKHQRGTDFGQGRITAMTGSVQACLRHDWHSLPTRSAQLSDITGWTQLVEP